MNIKNSEIKYGFLFSFLYCCIKSHLIITNTTGSGSYGLSKIKYDTINMIKNNKKI